MSMPTSPRPKAARCPICSRAAAEPFRPFCSERCRQVDLGRWLNGGYAIPGAPLAPDEDEAEES
jgi:endogenous inhibitor of DNA gyrase (YacG/DUF329 family)